VTYNYVIVLHTNLTVSIQPACNEEIDSLQAAIVFSLQSLQNSCIVMSHTANIIMYRFNRYCKIIMLHGAQYVVVAMFKKCYLYVLQ